ncbi:hypothetical protein ACIBEF_32085 [Micromonospora sp. NPDC050795]
MLKQTLGWTVDAHGGPVVGALVASPPRSVRVFGLSLPYAVHQRCRLF